ncbi:MAG: hypothetical protein A3H95_01705 [Acidobacteria bacterium RIFCSPLOWO2_02_FULL_64_15]|nr:MAG: hypothetical protein A3H95_01705 [Acidobacteria bacterium RIFCSPLOWO2_02_FULL_64_15]
MSIVLKSAAERFKAFISESWTMRLFAIEDLRPAAVMMSFSPARCSAGISRRCCAEKFFATSMLNIWRSINGWTLANDSAARSRIR